MNNFTKQDLRNITALIKTASITGESAEQVAILLLKLKNAIDEYDQKPTEKVREGNQESIQGDVKEK